MAEDRDEWHAVVKRIKKRTMKLGVPQVVGYCTTGYVTIIYKIRKANVFSWSLLIQKVTSVYNKYIDFAVFHQTNCTGSRKYIFFYFVIITK